MAFNESRNYSGPIDPGDEITPNLLNSRGVQVVSNLPTTGVNEGVIYLLTGPPAQLFYDTGSRIEALASGVIPGEIKDFAGNSIPAGYLECNGQAVSRTTYAPLFAVIGTRWGAGNGASTFNVPNLNRRTTIGAGGTRSAGPGTSVGNTGGSEQHSLTVAQLASHNHTAQPHDHTYANLLVGETPRILSETGVRSTPSTRNTGDTTVTINSTGNGAAHNNMPPSAVVRKIIKT